jgi:hypothetical protein
LIIVAVIRGGYALVSGNDAPEIVYVTPTVQSSSDTTVVTVPKLVPCAGWEAWVARANAVTDSVERTQDEADLAYSPTSYQFYRWAADLTSQVGYLEGVAPPPAAEDYHYLWAAAIRTMASAYESYGDGNDWRGGLMVDTYNAGIQERLAALDEANAACATMP